MEILLGMLAAVVAWLSLALNIVRENERAIKVLLGNPGATVESGLRLVWWPLQKLVRYPTTQQEIEIPERTIITAPGEYPPGSGENYSAARISVEAVIYIFWPGDLRNAVVRGPNPQDREAVKDFFEETVADAIRIAGGERTWRACVQERQLFSQRVHAILTAPGTPFTESGINRLHIVIKEIKLPEGLQTAITRPEIARLEAEARKRQGQGEKDFLTLQGQGEAAARQAIFETIQKGGIEKEVLLTLREMAKGTSNTILFGLPPQIYETLSNAMGGKRPEDLLKLLSEEDQKWLIEKLSQKQKK